MVIFSLFQGCTESRVAKKTEKEPTAEVSLKVSLKNQTKNQTQIEVQKIKQIASGVRFAASIEREILKTIRPGISPAMTQLEVVSTIIDQSLGLKKNFERVDCKLYQVVSTDKKIEIFRQCQSPKVLIATVDVSELNKPHIHFYTKEWANTVGQSVALTASDRSCDLKIEIDKLKQLSCQNTNLVIDQSAEIEELRLSEFIFDQNSSDQVQVKGAFYKNLIEHRKLSLSIPFDGKIKIIEKELKIQDDFIEPLKTIADPEITKPEAPLQKTEEDSYDTNSKNRD